MKSIAGLIASESDSAVSLHPLGGSGAFSLGELAARSPSSQPPDLTQAAWDAATRIKLSLAPEGTQVSNHTNELFTAFENTLSDSSIHKAISTAAQIWIRWTGVNIGIVQDDGSPFGSSGLTQADPRFGDIRVGAIPMAEDAFAITVRNNELTSGTWSGDILFNSNATFDNYRHFLSVATHEMGHALGLEHRNDPLAIMHPTINNYIPSDSDFNSMRRLYGLRQIDRNEDRDKNNDSFDDATRIKSTGSINGQIPFVVFGDISNRRDVDFYELRNLSNYEGPITFRVVSSGISQLAPQITVFGGNGNVMESRTRSTGFGADMSITIPQAQDGEDYFLKVEAGGNPFYSVGSYAVVASFDDLAGNHTALLNEVLAKDFSRLKQRDIQDLFLAGSDPMFNDDVHTNDTFATAEELDFNPQFTRHRRYLFDASLTDINDVDFYSFESPDPRFIPDGRITVRLRAIERDGLIPTARLLDQDGQVITHRIVVNGNGEYVIQADGIQADQRYYLRVAANQSGNLFRTGSYHLDLGFNRPAINTAPIATGILNGDSDLNKHSLFVAETQMFHLGLAATAGPANQLSQAIVWSTIYDEQGNVVYRNATRGGELRTAQSVILRPGSYEIQVSLAQPDGEGNYNFRYRLTGRDVSDPQGPELIDPTTLPFPKCKPGSEEFCYPKNNFSIEPVLVLNGGLETPPPDTSPPPHMDLNQWYWTQNWLQPNL